MGLYNICVSWCMEYDMEYCGVRVCVVTKMLEDATSGEWRGE